MISLVLALAVASQPCGGSDGIKSVYSTWLRAYDSRDLAGTMAIFSPDATMSFAGSPDQNYKALMAGYRRDFSKPGATWKPTFEPPNASGTLGVALSRWRYERNGKLLSRTRGVDVLRCTARGWKIFRSLNYVEWTAPSR